MHLNRFSFKFQALMKIDFWHSLKCDIILILGVVQDMLTDASSQDEWLNVSISMLTRCSFWEHSLDAAKTPHRDHPSRGLWHHLAPHLYVNITHWALCLAIFQDTHKSRFMYHYPPHNNRKYLAGLALAVSSSSLLHLLSSPSLRYPCLNI